MPHVDASLYVMTPEFGAASQLEKIDMLDFADFVAINKFDRKGADGCAARRAQAVPAQPRAFNAPTERCRCSAPWPRASTTTASPRSIRRWLPALAASACRSAPALPVVRSSTSAPAARHRPADRVRYLAEIAETVRGYHKHGRATAGRRRPRAPVAETAKALRRLRQDPLRDFDELIADWKDGELTRMPRRSCSTCGRTPSRPTPATSTW